MANAKWSDAAFTEQSSVALTDKVVGLVGGANSKFTLTVLQAALAKVGKVTVTQPASGSTLTIPDGITLNAGVGGTLGALSFITPGSSVATALGVNVGSAGAIVVNGGALGTPSSGVLTNCTGLPAASVPNAAADGATKGVATFTATDFNAASGVISLDYANGQAATALQNGFLSSTDWSTFDGKLGTSVLDTDGTLAANSDAKIATQKAVKTYVDTSVTGLLDFKGNTDASANPNYPAALKGDAYYISVAGKVGGASGKSVDIGDVYVANADNAGGTEASVGTSWFVLEHNLVGAVVSGGPLGTPSSGTLTNCSGLPIAGLSASTSTAIGVGSIELGHATDTTITRTGSGDIAVEGNAVYRAGGTDVPVTDGGTGSSTAAGAIANLGGLPTAGGTMSGDITLGENTSVALDPAGSADGKYTGITVTGTGGATIAFGDLITLDKDDSRWELVDISVAAAATGDARGILGMAVTSSTDGTAVTVLLHGIIRADANFPALTIGAPVYASTTGDVVVAQPTTTDYVIRIIGYALTADELYFNPGNSWTTHT